MVVQRPCTPVTYVKDDYLMKRKMNDTTFGFENLYIDY